MALEEALPIPGLLTGFYLNPVGPPPLNRQYTILQPSFYYPQTATLADIAMLSLYATLFLSAIPLSLLSACVTNGYIPCPPDGGSNFGVTLPPDLLSGGLGFPDNLQSGAMDPIQGRSIDMEDTLAKRQNALCCRPAPVQCRILTQGNVTFCYDPSNTRWFFSDGSYYFSSNGTYYGSDGTVVDFVTGDYSYPNGTTGNIYTDNGQTPPSTSTLSLAQPTDTGSQGGTAAASTSTAATGSGGSTSLSPLSTLNSGTSASMSPTPTSTGSGVATTTNSIGARLGSLHAAGLFVIGLGVYISFS